MLDEDKDKEKLLQLPQNQNKSFSIFVLVQWYKEAGWTKTMKSTNELIVFQYTLNICTQVTNTFS